MVKIYTREHDSKMDIKFVVKELIPLKSISDFNESKMEYDKNIVKTNLVITYICNSDKKKFIHLDFSTPINQNPTEGSVLTTIDVDGKDVSLSFENDGFVESNDHVLNNIYWTKVFSDYMIWDFSCGSSSDHKYSTYDIDVSTTFCHISNNAVYDKIIFDDREYIKAFLRIKEILDIHK